MATLTVNVENEDGSPASGIKVTVFHSDGFLPQSYIEDYTDDDGVAELDVPNYCTADVHADGAEQLSDIQITGSDEDVTISL